MQVGMSSAAGFRFMDDDFRVLAQSGIHNIEISLPFKAYKEFDYQEAQRLSKTYGVNLWSFHLPFYTLDVLDIASQDETVRKQSVAYWCELIRKASDIGVDKFVAHPSSEPKSENPRIRNEEMKFCMDSLNELAIFADSCNSCIAVEDLPRSCLGRNSDEMLQLLSVNEKLRVCFDTNHLLKEDNLQFIEKIGSKIVTLHVSDYDFVDERHWLPGEGKNDWHGIYKKLLTVGYSGVWMYEIGLKNATIQGKELTYADVIRNTHEIMHDFPLTKMG